MVGDKVLAQSALGQRFFQYAYSFEPAEPLISNEILQAWALFDGYLRSVGITAPDLAVLTRPRLRAAIAWGLRQDPHACRKDLTCVLTDTLSFFSDWLIARGLLQVHPFLPSNPPDWQVISTRPPLNYVVGPDGKVKDASDYTCMILGYTLDRLVGQDATRLLRPGENVDENLRRIFLWMKAHPGKVRHVSGYLVADDGHHVVVHATVHWSEAEQGWIVVGVIGFRDVIVAMHRAGLMTRPELVEPWVELEAEVGSYEAKPCPAGGTVTADAWGSGKTAAYIETWRARSEG